MQDEYEPRFALQELEEASGLPRRTIRLYISRGLVPPACGRGRSAYYTSEHLEAIARISDARQRGLSLDEIGDSLERQRPAHIQFGEDWRRFELAEGVELFVRADSAAAQAELIRGIIELANRAAVLDPHSA